MQSLTETANLSETTLSHIFITADVNATGRRSFMVVMAAFFGTGTMQEAFQHNGNASVLKHNMRQAPVSFMGEGEGSD